MPLSVPLAVEEFVNARTMRLARLWIIDPVGRSPLYFTDHDKTIPYDGNDYEPAGGFDASAERLEGALKDHNKSLKGFITSDKITTEDLMGHVYDEAVVTEMLIDWKYPYVPFYSRKYTIDKINFDGEVHEAEISGPTRKLKQQGGDVHTRTCPLKVGVLDPVTGKGCSVDLATHTQTNIAVVGTLDTQKRMIILADTTDLLGTFEDGHFDDGEIIFIDGKNANIKRDVKRYTQFDRRIELHEPFPFEIETGDHFTIIRGCDGRRTTCRDVFGNLEEFQGDPFMPFTDRTISAGAG
jgi:uncharacterized phage protein (TIGR02218 family)